MKRLLISLVLCSMSIVFTTSRAMADSADSLVSRVISLESQVSALSAALTQAQSDISTLKSENVSLKNDITALQANPVVQMGVPDNSGHRILDLVSDPNNDNVMTARFSGVNVQVVNGLGSTNTINGVGNLIVGYDEPRDSGDFFCSIGPFNTQADCEAHSGTWELNDKGGSHNLVVGRANAYAGVGGVVFGDHNAINSSYAVVTAGLYNIASGVDASVSGGNGNRAQGYLSSVTGGQSNYATGYATSVTGGSNNFARGQRATVTGGYLGNATGDWATVGGGQGNTASAQYGVQP